MKTSDGQLSPLYGVLLAGGRSRRMGSDKASLVYDGSGKSQAQKGLEMLASVCERTWLSLRAGQEAPEDVSPGTLVLRDSWPDCGPLGAILSAMDAEPEAAWLVVACDLPLVSEGTLADLASRRTGEPAFLAYRSAHDGLPEPLCAIYEPRARSILHRYHTEGARCPRKILMQEETLLVDSRRPEALDNANTPEDLNAIRGRLQQGRTRTYTVLYFGSLGAERGLGEESIRSQARNPAELLAELKSRHGLRASQSFLRVAIGHDLTEWESPLHDNDIVAFLPPMAGG